MKLRIENVYEDGHTCEKEVEITPEPAVDDMDVEREREYSNGDWDEIDWWGSVVYEHTGCGHGLPENHGGDRTLSACSTATIIEADNPELVDISHEWIG